MDSCKEESFIIYIMLYNEKGHTGKITSASPCFFSDLLRKEHRPCDRPAIIQNANFVYLGEVKKGQIPVLGAFLASASGICLRTRLFSPLAGRRRCLAFACVFFGLPNWFLWDRLERHPYRCFKKTAKKAWRVPSIFLRKRLDRGLTDPSAHTHQVTEHFCGVS